MAQIKKGFIAANAIDGSKLQLLNNEAIRAANADGSDVELMKLDGSNVLQFLKMPQVSSDPSAGNDVARKSYVDTSVSSAKGEVEALLTAEQVAREAADAAEQSARESADSVLQGNIDSEASARESGDVSLQNQINDILSNVDPSALDSLSEIVGAFQAADSDLQAAITSALGTHTSELATEVADRTAADADLQSQINSLSSGSSSALDAETAAREAADTAEQTAREAADSAEASARQSADNTLQSNIDNETSARQSADSALQATIDALDVNDLGSVNIADAQDGDLWQFDLESGKWVNVAPLSEAGVSSSVETLYLQQTAGYFDASQSANPRYLRGISFFGNGEPVSKLVVKLKYNSGSGTVKFLLRDAFTAAPLAVSSEVDITTITFGQMVEFTFSSPATLTSGTRYYAEIFLTGGEVGIEWNQGPAGSYSINYFWYDTQGGGSEIGGAWTASVYTGSPGGTSTGVIKTNSDGMLDDSFVSSAIARVSDMDAADSAEQAAREAADSTLQSNIDAEAAARQAAVSAEQTARENADAGLQSQIDTLSSSSSGALAQEISDRQAADSAEQTAREAADTTLQSNIDSESSARQAADTTLQSNIDTEKARIDAILTAATADADSFAEIVNLINSVDTENDSAFASYVLSNDAALAQEVSDRTAAVSAEQSARESADSTETSAREAADATLQSNIDAEAASRQAADVSLQSEVDAVESALAQEVSDRTAAVSAEQSARETADQGLQDAIDALDSGNAAALAQEVSDRLAGDAAEQTAREAADSALQAAVDQEVSDRTAAVSAEQVARESADSAEQTAREAADATLQGNIDSETASREAADSALDTRVTALEAVSHHKEKFVITSTDVSNGYIDLAMECTVDSEMMFVGSLYTHEGDDYTVSTVGGKTRLTFAGPLAVGGASEMLVGDVVYVRYTK
jgi:hypothetical protein